MNLLKCLTLCLLTTVSFSACSNVEKEQEGIKVIDYSNPKKVCFGRIELTVPKETQVEYSNFNYNGSNIEVDESIKTYEAYQKLINDKIQYLKNSPHETQKVLLTKESQGPVQRQGKSISHIIIFRESEYVKSIYEVYGYLYLGSGKLLILKSESSNELLSSAITDMEHNLKSIKLKFSKENESGLCWKDFLIIDDNKNNTPFGGGYLHFTFPSYPGVRIDIEHRVTYESDISLIKMMKKNREELPDIVKLQTSINNLREGGKVIHGLKGEEVLNHIHQRGHFDRGFEDGAWQYLGTLDKSNDPYIQLNLESAQMDNNDIESTVSQKKVIELYDFILNSLKAPSKENLKGL